jgi:hypothetical protein
MSRLRRLLGCLLIARPYRLLADIDVNILEVEQLVRAGALDAAGRRYRAPLLARSNVPGIVEPASGSGPRYMRRARPGDVGLPYARLPQQA